MVISGSRGKGGPLAEAVIWTARTIQWEVSDILWIEG